MGCRHGSCVVTVAGATPALLQSPALIHSPSPRSPPPPKKNPLLLLPSPLSVYEAYPYMARSFFREQLLRDRCCKQCCERLCQQRPSSMHTQCRYVNTLLPGGAVKTSPLLQVSVLQEVGDKEANGVRVDSRAEAVCAPRLVPAQLGAEPLEEVQLLGCQPGSQHASCANVRLLRTCRSCRYAMWPSIFLSSSAPG